MSKDENISRMKVITQTIQEIINRYDNGKDFTVNEIKKYMSNIAREIQLNSIPKLVDLV
jgi:hypothetical protein